jgi:4-hydroxyphenylacetate 3-monooxygenase
MPARTGEQYLAGLRSRTPEVYLHGKRVEDVTNCPGLANGARSVAGLYDMQHDPKLRSEMTYDSPSSGEPVGLSFIAPRTLDDLRKRRAMMSHWARTSYGMMGRTPDFLNVSMMAMAEAGDYFGGNRPEFKQNIVNYYEHVRENDLTLTHTLVNLQRNRRQLAYSRNYSTDVAMQIVKETDAGIVVRGPRVLATLGPLSDEIAVYPVRNSQLEGTEEAWRYAFAFSIPCDTPGLRFLCRESFDLGRSTFDHPLGSRFEEMDATVFFDDVFVPWERVFLLGDADLLNEMPRATNSSVHTAHQGAVKNVAKSEFVLGVALLMARTLGSEELPHVKERLAELMTYTEVMKASLRAAEADARVDQWGVMCPDELPLEAIRTLFMSVYSRMVEILQLLGSSSFMALPSEADFETPLAAEIERYLATDTASARERVQLFHLAWDVACSAFGGRQVLYERFFAGDPLARAGFLYSMYPKEPLMERIREFLGKDN